MFLRYGAAGQMYTEKEMRGDHGLSLKSIRTLELGGVSGEARECRDARTRGGGTGGMIWAIERVGRGESYRGG